VTSSSSSQRAYFVIVLGVAAMVAWGFWPSYFGPLLRWQ
jgi:hypothetical protein